MKRRWNYVAAALVVAAAVSAGAAAGAAGNAGSADDPLVTLSYLNQVFAPSLNSKIDQAVKANEDSLKADLNSAIDRWSQTVGQAGGSGGTAGSGSAAFTVVTLSKGQTLTGEVGCELMLRVGSASCVSSSSPGLIDTTSGGTLDNGGALVKNHLYMVTIETRGVQATANTVKVLARGSYTVS